MAKDTKLDATLDNTTKQKKEKKKHPNQTDFRKVKAIFKKEIKDALRSNKIIFLFLLFPVFAYFITFTMKGDAGTNPLIFLMMHISMIPLMITASLIAEEKDNKTLRVLILSNVKPMEYLLGVGSFVFILNLITACVFLPILDMSLVYLPQFLLVCALGILCSTVVGAIIGVVVKAGANIAAVSAPATIVFALVPLMGMGGNGFFATISQCLFSGQLITIIFDFANNFTFLRMIIMCANLLVFLIVFIIVYAQNRLAE